jgi:hypothetical protein
VLSEVLPVELFKQSFSFLEVANIETLGKPPIDLREHLARFSTPALASKQPR